MLDDISRWLAPAFLSILIYLTNNRKSGEWGVGSCFKSAKKFQALFYKKKFIGLIYNKNIKSFFIFYILYKRTELKTTPHYPLPTTHSPLFQEFT